LTRFLLLYKSSTSASEMMAAATPEQMQAGMEDWKRWSASAAEAIVDLGSPLGEAASVGGAASGTADQHITGFSILQADSRDAVTALLENHPHLKTPGDSSIAVLEVMSMPGM
jgi:hypothetical protein